jgi:hypothetical protein
MRDEPALHPRGTASTQELRQQDLLHRLLHDYELACGCRKLDLTSSPAVIE